jgi:uncharacterized damage-inducible protein DinB
MDDTVFRQALVTLLRDGQAHATLLQALERLEPANRGRRPSPELHSVYEELEHMRIAQEDILRYTLDPEWRSPEWPGGYWPTVVKPTGRQWLASLEAFVRDLDAVVAMVNDPAVDLTAPIPHGEGRTYLREALLVADHNAYHAAQMVDARRLLGAWGRQR